MPARALVCCAVLLALTACFDFDAAYDGFCDGGRCASGGGAQGGGATGGGMTGGGATGGGSATGGGATGGGATGGGATGGGATGGGATGGGAVTGGGSATGGGATGGGGDDGGTDAGCGGPVQLDVIAPASLGVGTCSSVAKVRVLDACGAPFTTTSSIPVALSSDSVTLQLFNDTACSFMPSAWTIAGGMSELDLYVQDATPGVHTVRADSAGLDSGVGSFDFACAGNQRACPSQCVPAGGCCNDTECDDGGVQYLCNMTSHQCVPPPCSFPANCTTYDDRTASGASRTVTFDSSGYSPKCMRVTTSQDVTFSGSFSIHPLQQFCGPSDRNMTTTFGTTKTVRFSDFGTYGYRCKNHPVFEQGAIRTP